MDRFGRKLADRPVRDDEEFVIEKILNKRKLNGEVRYLVKWEDYDSRYNSWEPESCFNSRDLILEFEERFSKKMSELAKKKRPRRKLLLEQRRQEASLQQPGTSAPKPRRIATKARMSRGRPTKLPKMASHQPNEDNEDEHDDDDSGESSGEENEHGFSKGYTAEAIVGAGKVNGQPSFLIKWQGNRGTEFIPTHIVYEKDPKLACLYYESKIVWVD